MTDLEETVSKLEAFLNLYYVGISNYYVKGNIQHLALKYKEETGNWYKRSISWKRKVI